MGERVVNNGKVVGGPEQDYVQPYSHLWVQSNDGVRGEASVAVGCGLRVGDRVVFDINSKRVRVNSPKCNSCPLRKGYGGNDECGFPCSAWKEIDIPVERSGVLKLIDRLRELV